MTPLSAATAERSRKFFALALRAVAALGQNQLAANLSTSETTVSRYLSSDLERACHVIAAAGLKVVPGEMRCFDPSRMDAILVLARAHLNTLENVEQLSFD